MKHISLFSILFAFTINLYSQNSFKAAIRDEKTQEILVGATAYIPLLKKGAATDSNGQVIIKNIPDGKFEISFSYTGHEKKAMEFIFPIRDSLPITILLTIKDQELGEVVVQSTRTNSRIKDIPIRVEVIGGDELKEKVDMRPSNISMLLSEATGIQPQQTSAVNGNISIRLQGLDGKYTQILKDGFPLYGGFAQGLSIMQIPPLDLQQVEVIKGSSSSLYGSDAIAGIINLISKQPQEKKELNLLLNQTSLLGSDINGYYSQRWKKFGISLLSSNSYQAAKDVNKDGFSDIPLTKAFTFNPKLFFYIDSNTSLQFGINTTFDNRKGGDMQVIKNKPDSAHQFFEEDISNRFSTQFKFEKHLANDKNLTIKNSVSFFDRAINQATSNFKGNQISSYSEVAYNFNIKNHQLVAGANLITEKFSEDSSKSHLQRNYNYVTSGAFVQDDWKPSKKVSLQAGIRTDYQSQFYFFFLPRLAVMYKFTNAFYVRAGSGLGYKIPSIFSTSSEEEGINNIQPLAANIKAEKSIGYNLDFNYKAKIGDEIMAIFNQSFFLTRINQPVVLDTTQFVNKDKPIITSGFESEVRLRWDGLKLFMGYTFVDARRKYDTIQNFVPLTPRHKIVTTLVYEKEENYAIGLEGFYTSSMFRDSDTRTKPYWIIGLMVQKHFKNVTLVANCENIFDQRQTRFENIVIPPTVNPTFRQVYAPLDGRVFNIALRIKI